MPTFISQPNRDASDAIRGYVYQVDITIQRWLALKQGEALELERGEDIDLISRSLPNIEERTLEQVKNYSKSITLRSAVEAIANFIDHRQNNPGLKDNLRFIYTTTASVGKERFLPETLKKKEGIVIWEQLRQGYLEGILQEQALQGIRQILSNTTKPKKIQKKTWDSFENFIANASNNEFIELIRNFEWSTKAPSIRSLKEEIITIIRREYATDALQAQQQYERLFLHTFKLLCQSGIKRLTIEECRHQLSLPTLNEEDRNLLEKVLIKLVNLEARLGSLEEQVFKNTESIALVVEDNDQLKRRFDAENVKFSLIKDTPHLDLSVPILNHLTRREENVKALTEIINQHTWTAIYGIAGSGKTHLAVLVAQSFGNCSAWLQFCDLTIEQASQQLDSALKELVELPQQTNGYNWYCQICEELSNNTMLVLDELPEMSGSDELSRRLSQLARACRVHGVRLLSTSPYQLPFTLQESLGDAVLHSLEVPDVSDREASEILQAYGAPTPVVEGYTRFINLRAQKHPIILAAIAKYLRQKNWQITDEIESSLLKGEYHNHILDNQTIRRILDSVEDDNARELLYRLCLPVASFSLNEVQTVACVEPPLLRPIERLYALVGLWVQQDVNERLRISPLVKPLGEKNLLPQTKKSCHLSLGELILSKQRLTPQDVTDTIIHFVGAEAFDRAGLMLISALQKINSMDELADGHRLLTLWDSPPLPEQMDLGIRLYLRGLQVATRYKYNKDITYIVEDMDVLFEQASENEAWAVVGVTATTNLILVQEDLNRANHYLLKALHFSPNVLVLNSNELVFPEGISLELMIWSNAQGINTVNHLNNWIETVEQLTPEQRQQVFTHPVAELGCLIVSEKVWLRESEKPQEQRNWSLVLEAYENLANKARQLDLWLLWASAIRSQIIILGSYVQQITRAVSLAELAIQEAPDEPRIRFLVSEAIGQQYAHINRNNEALNWLSKALGEETDAYPNARLKVLLSTSRIIGERDQNLAIEFARQAVDLAISNNAIDEIDLVKALGELAIAQWMAGDSPTTFFETWQQAGNYLLNCRPSINTRSINEIPISDRNVELIGSFASLPDISQAFNLRIPEIIAPSLEQIPIDHSLFNISLVPSESVIQTRESLVNAEFADKLWKELFVIYGHICGYFTFLATTNSPPSVTRSGESYAAPKRGIFLTHNPGRTAYYNRNLECTVLAQLSLWADAIGNQESAATWALRGMDDARVTNQNIIFARLSLEAIPHLLLDNRYAEVLDFALDAGAVWTAVIQQQRDSGKFPEGFELNVEAILGNNQNELWQQAEYNSALIGLVPVVFRISTVALQQLALAHEQATEVAASCRQISETAIEPQFWTTPAELLEQVFLPEKTYGEIINFTDTLNQQNNTIYLLIVYLAATLSNDISLQNAILAHLELAKIVYEQLRPRSSATYQKIVLPFFISYWRIKFENTPLEFRSSQLVNQRLSTAENIPEPERLQLILLTIAFSLNIALSPELRQWLVNSAPGVSSFFNNR